MTIFTIGHSNRTIEAFVGRLQEHRVELVADIRTIPKSRHNPQFSQDQLPDSLANVGINYTHLEDLGGLRRAQPESINSAWRNSSFRGYADYMQTDTFTNALDELVEAAGRMRTVIMCAEAVPWRCHRSLVEDSLLVRCVEVIDIMGPSSCRAHKLTPFAQVDGTTITYPLEYID